MLSEVNSDTCNCIREPSVIDMANTLQSHWTYSVRSDAVSQQALPHRRVHAQSAASIQSSSRGQTWSGAQWSILEGGCFRHFWFTLNEAHRPDTGCSCPSTSRKPVLCRAVAAAEPAQQQLDVTKVPHACKRTAESIMLQHMYIPMQKV